MIRDWSPLPWQVDMARAVLSGAAPAYAVRGGRGCGKSQLLCVLAELLCVTRPGAQVVLCMDTAVRLRAVHLPLLLAQDMGATYNGLDASFLWPSGSRLLLRHLDVAAHATSPLEGYNAHAVILDECQALRPSVLDVAATRARIGVVGVDGVEHQPLVVCSGVPLDPAWWVDRVVEVGGVSFFPTTAENAEHLGAGYIDRMREILTPREFAASIENRPLPPEGRAVYSWDAADYPAGRVLRSVDGRPWMPDPATMRIIGGHDFGLRSPASVVLAEDLALGAWVVIDEWAEDESSTPDQARALASLLVPRSLWRRGDRSGRWPCDALYVDPAGAARNAQTMTSDVDLVGRPRDRGGVGMAAQVERAPDRRSVADGLARLCRSLHHGRLLVWSRVQDAGLRARAGSRTLARSLAGLELGRNGEPRKDQGHDHHVDALRYAHRAVLWHDEPTTRRPAAAAISAGESGHSMTDAR